MIFPFKYFTSMKSLEEKTLPTNKKFWFNDLTQEPFTDEQIAEAFEKFNKYNCKNIREYLEMYLKMDVKLTVIGVIRLLGKFFDQFEIHPLDVNKTTIASFGSYLFQHNLMRNSFLVNSHNLQ